MASSSSSSLISNIETTVSDDRSLESKKKRRKKNQNQTTTPRWRSADEQQIYSTKLLDALRQVRRSSLPSISSSSSLTSSNSNSSSNSPPTGRVVREAADRALAVTAKGRTRWSRAILTNKLRLKFKKKKPRMITGCNSRSSKKPAGGGGVKKQKRLLPLQRKVRVLGRIVPGCRKLSFPVLLEETTDYIAALEMQVRTMTVLTQLLSAAGSLGSSSSSANSQHQLGSSQTS